MTQPRFKIQYLLKRFFMKKEIGKDQTKKPDIIAKSSLTEAGLLLCLVEMLADQRNDTGFCHQQMPSEWRLMETSSIEAYVNGNTTVQQGEDIVTSVFISSFIFTCSRTKDGDHCFQWLSSLS